MRRQRVLHIVAAAVCIGYFCFALPAQQVVPLSPGLTRRSGTDLESGIAYSLTMLEGKLVSVGSPADAEALPLTSTAPTLTAQCTRLPNGKLVFELFANYGGVQDTVFHPPWHPRTSSDLFPPTTQKTSITFNFFGYTKVKPISRQWESVADVPGQWRYNSPSRASRNMEEVSFYLQYLRALPTLRLTQNDHAAQFNVNQWMEALRNDPLCKASSL